MTMERNKRKDKGKYSLGGGWPSSPSDALPSSPSDAWPSSSRGPITRVAVLQPTLVSPKNSSTASVAPSSHRHLTDGALGCS